MLIQLFTLLLPFINDALYLNKTLYLTCCCLDHLTVGNDDSSDTLVVWRLVIDKLNVLLDFLVYLLEGHVRKYFFIIYQLECYYQVSFIIRFRNTENNSLVHIWKRCDELLELLREDIFAVLKNDDILLSSCDEDEALLVDFSEVACVEPSVDDYLVGSLLVAIVSEHDSLAASNNLSNAVLIRIIDSDFNTRNRNSDRTGVLVLRSFGSQDRGCLCKTVALHGQNSEALKAVDAVDISCSTADDAHPP